MDEYVASARSHWGPRFTANGVPAADFARVVDGLESWDDWCAAWSAAARIHEDLGIEALEQGRLRSAGAHLSTAAVVYHFAKFVFVRDLVQMRAAHDAAVRCLDAALPHLDPPGERIELPFDGSTIYGILRKPAGQSPHPAVILVPGLDSTKEELRATEDLFLQRGLATFSVDGPGQGEAEYDLPIRADWEVPGRAFVDALVARDDIDADRIGVWGVSLGGYYAPRFASGDERIKACVSLCGPYTFGESWDMQACADQGDVRGPVALEGRRRRPRLGAHAHDGGSHGVPALPDADRGGQEGPADPLATGPAAAPRSRGKRVPPARGRQPRLRQCGCRTPVSHGGLDGRPPEGVTGQVCASIAATMLSWVNGSARTRTPRASASALPIAAGTGP